MSNREPLEYEIYRQRMIEYELQMNSLAAQRAIINMGKQQSHQPQQPIHVVTQTTPIIQTVEVQSENDNRLRHKIDDLKFDVRSHQKEIKELQKEIEEVHEHAREMFRHVQNSHERFQDAMAKIDEQALEIQRLKGELQRLGGAKQAITPQHTPLAKKPVLRGSMDSQGGSESPDTFLFRWIIQKSIENMPKGYKKLYIPSDSEVEKLKFMEQHQLYRMNEIEIPTEHQHRINMEIWEAE